MNVLLRGVRFGIVGGTGAVFNLALLILLVEWFHWNPLVSAIVTIEASTLINYALNRVWTWQDRASDHWSIIHYHSATLVGIIVQWLTVAVGVGLGVHYAVAAFVGIGIASGWNFLAHHRFTFAHAAPGRREARARLARYVLAGALLVVGAAFLTHDWDTFVFERSVEDLVQRGVTPYETTVQNPDYIYFGIGTPIFPLWYAYPPLPLLMMTATYWPVAAGLADQAWLGRILVKLPFIAATLGVAYLARRFLERAPGPDAPRLAKKAETLLLFNPLFLLVAMVWGQFESAVLVLLVLSLLALRSQRWMTSGLFWGLAVLVKIFPLYLGPVWLVYLVRRAGWRAATRFFGAGGAIAGLVSFPFVLDQPGGFLQQVFLMHSDRPPARFSPIAFVYEMLRWTSNNHPGILPNDFVLAEALGLLSFTLTAFVLGLLALGFTRTSLSERDLVMWSGMSLLGGLLVTKVVSEQYMLLPLAFLLLYRYYPGATTGMLGNRSANALIVSITAGFTVAGLLDNVHFLIFIPEDVARVVLPMPVPELILHLGWFFGWTTTEFRVALAAIVGIGLVPSLWFAVRALAPFLLGGFEAIAHRVARPLSVAPPPRHHLGATLAVVAVLLLMPPLALGAVGPTRPLPPPGAGAMEDLDPLVLAHYRANWFNPTARPEVPGGTWPNVAFTPASGYYNSIAYKAAQDIDLLRRAEVDALVIPFDPAYESSTFAVVNVAEQEGLPYALEIRVESFANSDGSLPLSDATARRARELFDGPSFRFWRGGYHLRLDADSPRLLFLDGLDRFRPTFTDDERRFVANMLTPGELLALQGPRPSDPAWLLAPRTEAELDADTPPAALWRDAYARAQDRWWEQALGFLDEDKPENGLEFMVSARPDYRFPATLPVQVRGTYEPVTAQGPLDEVVLVRHVPARPGELDAFRTAWEATSATRPLAVLVAWNDFDLGYAVEPTIEGGASLLEWLVQTRGNGTLPPIRVSPTMGAKDDATFASYL